MADNSSLGAAKSAKNDEFYTQYSDIEAEMNAYVEYNPDVFRGKTILLPCDDPEWSNFTKYFANNFERFGLKKLISTSYAKGAGNKQLTLFEMESPLYDADMHDNHGKLFTLTRDTDGSGYIDTDDIEFNGYLKGDGDFRSEEVCQLRDEADIIITNPPFSQFREFLAWIVEGNKQFIILGNMNAITYKEVFPSLKNNKIWLGYKSLNTDMYFGVTNEYKEWLLTNKKEGSAYKIINGVVMGRLASACWFTNIDHGKRHKLLSLDTMEHNLKYNKRLRKKFESDLGEIYYPHYDNYDAIEVPFTECIPSDYLPCWYSCPLATKCEWAKKKGVDNNTSALCDQASTGAIGVPITYMDKYNPEQFEIVKFRKGNDEKDLTFTVEKGDNSVRREEKRREEKRREEKRREEKNYALLQNHHSSQDVTESWEYQSLSSINSIQNSSELSEQQRAKEKDSQMACGKQHVVSHNLLFEGVANTRESLLFKKSNGVMGVPITFMDKYNPEQFEIVWQASGNTRASAPREILCELNYIKHDEDRGGCSVVKGKRTYGRILIRRKGGEVF